MKTKKFLLRYSAIIADISKKQGKAFSVLEEAETYIAQLEGEIEHATAWTSVFGDTPDNKELVLVKTDTDCYAIAYCDPTTGLFIPYGWDAYANFGDITHWKYLPHKNYLKK